MLNARLADFAMNLEHAEEQIWRLWCLYQGYVWDGEIEYPRTFSIQDKANDIAMLKMAKEANIGDARINQEIDKRIYETITEEYLEDMDEMEEPYEMQSEETHTPVAIGPDMIAHLREMISQGATDDEILQMHPELRGMLNANS
jgi:hypothetical protein